MKSAAAFAALALALSPAFALAQGETPNDAAHPAAGSVPADDIAPATPARPMERAMPGEPMSGRSAVRPGEPSAAPSSGETPSGEPPVGMGRGEK